MHRSDRQINQDRMHLTIDDASHAHIEDIVGRYDGDDPRKVAALVVK